MENTAEEKSRSHKNPDMVLNLDSKSESFISDQTPTPIRLLQKCEEMGLFQDLQSVNPFEETFRKAAEDIRSGTTHLEVSQLSVPNNTDDSLHTPHVIFPLANELHKRKVISLREDISIPDADPLCISLDSDETETEPVKTVVQQEADTSEETPMPELNVSGYEDQSPFGGTIQFLLRMPNGKMVQLSSHPVEQMDNTPTSKSKEKDIPIIKVDSSFLKAVGDGTNQSTSTLNSAMNILADSGVGASTSSHGSSMDSNIVNKIHITNSAKFKSNSLTVSDSGETTEQLSKMSLAKLKLKQALMNNTCPATNLSSGVFSSASIPFVPKPSTSKPQIIEARRPSSPSDEGTSQDNLGHDLSSVEEKRKRNRAAAMRCREKRKTWVKELERRANDMMRTNGQLQHEVSMLRDEVAQLKTLLLAHRDCPVTQALVEGKATLPLGSTYITLSVTDTLSQDAKRSTNQKSPSSSVLFQTSNGGNPVKPHIFLSDPPVKRKRLNSSTANTVISQTAVSVMTSSSSSPSVHTLVLPSKSSTILNSSFVNVIPSVVVANPATCTNNAMGAPQQVIYPQLLSCLPAIAPKSNIGGTQQAYILPKAKGNPKAKVAPIILAKTSNVKQANSETKFRTTHFLSTNVIKLNPNVVERDNDSDIEILDVK